MELLTRSASVRDRIRLWRAAGGRVALVPTAGTLHKGHMSLVAEAQERADHVVVSIFAQREAPTLESDRELLHKMGVEVVFVPPVQELFPSGQESAAQVSVPALSGILEGVRHPKQFAAATTVLTKLFNIIQPNVVLLGERDFQQLVIVQRLVDDLFLSVEVVGCATWRESDGLAVASDNRQFTPAERALAPGLYAALLEASAMIDNGSRDFAALERRAVSSLRECGFEPEYVAIRQAADLQPVLPGARNLVVLAAVRLNQHRLYDNLRVRLIERH